MVLQQQECEEKWLMHYSSLHQILLVGDGDFSFSLCLANSFGSAFNILASSLDSYDMVTKKYKNAKSNLEKLRHLGATILHGVNAINMKLHTDLRMRKFDRIIFNFPHAGFHGKEDNVGLIQMHRNLISGFFRNASGMLRPYGEIHVNHKTTAPFCHWNLAELAKKSSLVLIDCVDFNNADYPGYNQKRGDGARCDEPFPLGKCSTFKFIFSPSANKIPNSLNHNGLAQRHPRVSVTTPQISTKFDAPYPFNAQTVFNGSSRCAGLAQRHPRVSVTTPQRSTTLPRVLEAPCPMPQHSATLPRVLEAPCPMPQLSTTFDARYPFSAQTVMNGSSHRAGLPQTSEKECLQIFGGYFNHAREPFGKTEYNIESSVPKQSYMVETSEKECLQIFGGYFNHAREPIGKTEYNIESSVPKQSYMVETSEKECLQIFGGYFNHAREPFGKTEYNIESSVPKQSYMVETSEKECLQIFGGYFNHAREPFGKMEYNIESSVPKQSYMVERPGGSLSGYTNLLEQLYHLGTSRSAGLRENLLCLNQQLM